MNDLFIQGISLHWDKVGKDSYLREIAAFQGLDQIRFNKPVTFFAGENGSGKSTLLEAIAVAHGFNPEGGTRNYNFSTRDTHSELCDAITVAKGYRRERWGYFLRAESFYNVATQENSMPMQHTLRHYTTKNLMAKAFCSLRKTISVGTAYISLMSRKPRFPHKGS